MAPARRRCRCPSRARRHRDEQLPISSLSVADRQPWPQRRRQPAPALSSIVVVDENRALGGQYYRRMPGEFRVTSRDALGANTPKAEP